MIDTTGTLSLTVPDLIGQRVAVLGISGSGKTNTVAVLVEELLPRLPVTIVDVEGEYYGLKECYDLLVAGRSMHAEVPLMIENAAAIADISIQRGISVILDLSEYDQDEMQAILLSYFEAIWKASTALKSPYEIVIEEAHEFVPQGSRTPLKTLLTRFALRGRKRGVGVILASQRSAKVEKDLLTQAGILFLHSVVHPTDVGVYKDLVPMAGKDVEQQARELVPGEAFVVRGKEADRVHIRRRHTFHAGATPELGAAPPPLKVIDAALLEELRATTARAVKDGGDEVSRLKKQLKEAEAIIAERDATIERLTERVELLSKLTVQGPASLEIEKAQVNHLHARTSSASVPSLSSPGAVETAITAKQIAPPLNEAKFASLQKRLSQVSVLERAILRVLVEQRRALSAKEIAAWLNKSERAIQDNPPRDLLKLGLIVRVRRGTAYVYRSRLVEYLQQEFPGVDKEALQARLLR